MSSDDNRISLLLIQWSIFSGCYCRFRPSNDPLRNHPCT